MNDEAKLKILIEAHNRAKQAFDEVNGQVAKTEKRFESMSNKLEKVGGKMKDVGAKMTTRLTLPLVAGAGLAVKAFSDLSETINKVDVSFGNNSNEVKKWAKTSITSMGLAEQSALDAAALFGDMGTGMGQTTEEASKMSRELVQLGADLSSFKNIGVAQSQTALAAIYTGETESLKRLGIIMTQTNLEEYARANGITKTIAEMTQAEKVQLRYKFVMASTTNAQGDFVRTSDGIANQTRMTGERVKQLAADFGEKLAPAFIKLLEVGSRVLDFFANLTGGQVTAIIIFAGLVAALGPVIAIIGNLVLAIRAIGLAFGFLAANPVILAVVAIILVVAGLAFLIYKNWGAISNFFIGLWKNISNAFKTFVNFIAGIFKPIIDFYIKIWSGIFKFFTDLWNGVVAIFTGVIDFFKKWGLTILAVLFWPFALAIGLIIANWEGIKGFFAGIWSFIQAVFAPIVAFFQWYFGMAFAIVKTIWSALVGFFTGIWEGIVAIFNGVVEFYRSIFTAAWEVIKAIWGAVSGWFGGIWEGIVKIFAPVVEFFANIFTKAWEGIKNVFNAVGGFFRGVWNTITGLFSSIGTAIGDAVGGAFKGILNTVVGGAIGIINGFINTINGAIDIINNIPGVDLGKIGNLPVPSFYTGVRNFGGGLATVGDVNGRGGELVSLPRGADVYNNGETKRILSALAGGEGGGSGMTFNNYGTISNENAEASNAFWNRMNRMSELASQGVPTNA